MDVRHICAVSQQNLIIPIIRIREDETSFGVRGSQGVLTTLATNNTHTRVKFCTEVKFYNANGASNVGLLLMELRYLCNNLIEHHEIVYAKY